tara:strand:- start:424 stop:1155 length:732 start_codon:yes stop_codon:yes gene_type:complete
MKSANILFFFFLLGLLSAITLEEFTYNTKFRNLRVGSTKIEILKEERNQTILKINASTNKFIDLLYKLRHFSTVIVNDRDFSLIATTQKLQQGKYIDSYNATVDYHLNHIAYQNTKDIKYDTYIDSLLIPINNAVYDPFSIVYYLRRFDIKIGEQYSFTTYNKNKLRDIDLYIEKIESLRTAYINTDCFVVVPRAKGPGPLLKHQGEMKIWFTADKQHIPVKIQVKMKHGIMELTLKDYVNKE